MYSYFRTVLGSQEPREFETADGYWLVPVEDEFHSSYDPHGFKAYTYTLVELAVAMGDMLHLTNQLWRTLTDLGRQSGYKTWNWDNLRVPSSQGEQELSQRIWDLIGLGVFATGRQRPIAEVHGRGHEHVSLNYHALKGGPRPELRLLHCGFTAEDVIRLDERFQGEIQDAFFKTVDDVYRYIGEQKVQLARSV